MHLNSTNSRITAADSKSGRVKETEFFFFIGFFIPILSPLRGFPSSAKSIFVQWTQPLPRVKVKPCVFAGYLFIRGTAYLSIIGVGIDIVDIDVFRSRLDDGMVNELFLPGEIEYCSSRARPWESYAARFAAKEASFKALGVGLSHGLRWKDVEIIKEISGAVSVHLIGKALERARIKQVKQVYLSISHSGENAIAVVTMEG